MMRANKRLLKTERGSARTLGCGKRLDMFFGGQAPFKSRLTLAVLERNLIFAHYQRSHAPMGEHLTTLFSLVVGVCSVTLKIDEA